LLSSWLGSPDPSLLVPMLGQMAQSAQSPLRGTGRVSTWSGEQSATCVGGSRRSGVNGLRLCFDPMEMVDTAGRGVARAAVRRSLILIRKVAGFLARGARTSTLRYCHWRRITGPQMFEARHKTMDHLIARAACWRVLSKRATKALLASQHSTWSRCACGGP